MATFNLVITYPDAEQARIIAALKDHYFGTTPNPVPTNGQAVEALRLDVARRIKDMVREREYRAAADAIVPVSPT